MIVIKSRVPDIVFFMEEPDKRHQSDGCGAFAAERAKMDGLQIIRGRFHSTIQCSPYVALNIEPRLLPSDAQRHPEARKRLLLRPSKL